MSDASSAVPKLAVIMAGGRGTRFWPRSRTHRPKQFLAMVGDKPLLRLTVDRLYPRFRPEHVYVVTTADLAADTRRMLPELPPENVLVEPEGRNTAPCLALALLATEAKVPDGVMVVLSADHWIGDEQAFLNDIELACRHAAERHELVTFGIRPAHPETGYGYIETEGGGAILKVKAFREKPPLATAVEYVQTGRHYWNAGIFVWTLADMRAELQAHSPEILRPLDEWAKAGADPAALPATYHRLPKTSIDYALMEKSNRVAVVPASFRWSDVGSWPAVVEFNQADGKGNVTQGDVLLVETSNCAFFGGKRLIAAAGISDLIVVDEPDALLLCHKDKAQHVKTIVEKLEAAGRKDLL